MNTATPFLVLNADPVLEGVIRNALIPMPAQFFTQVGYSVA